MDAGAAGKENVVEIRNHAVELPEGAPCESVLVVPGAAPESRQTLLQSEHRVSVVINGIAAMGITCSPSRIAELVLGRMCTEGVIASAADVVLLEVSQDAKHVEVQLACDLSSAATGLGEEVGTCSAGTVNLRSLLGLSDALPCLEPVPWTADEVFALAQAFASDTPMHRRTFGAHSCYLARAGEVLYCCEDLGRHNAFDKAIGCALADGVDVRTCAVFSSGRVPLDMVEKAIRAGVPTFLSKAVPTKEAVELARAHGLTLICSAYPDSFTVFSDPMSS